MEFVEYGGWPRCLRLANDQVELIIPEAVGPCIIHFGFIGGENEFLTNDENLGSSGGDDWILYGGHRVWHSPEDPVRTYQPENDPVAFTEVDGWIRVTGPIEPSTGMRKEMDLRIAPDTPRVEVINRIYNHNDSPVKAGPWGISMMEKGGTAIIPLPPRQHHDDNLAAMSTISLWAYTDMTDPRFIWGHRHILVRQDPSLESQQKIGAYTPDGWIAYARAGHLFMTRFEIDPAGRYPDHNASVEVYVDAGVLEVETLGPLVTLGPGESAELPLTWELFNEIEKPENEDDLPKILAKLTR